MNVHADTLVVRAEVDRRLELAGVDPHGRNDHGWHRHEVPARPFATHPLAAFVARLVGGVEGTAPVGARTGAPMASGRPRHS